MTQTSKPGHRRKPVVRDPWYVRARKHTVIATGIASLGVAAVATLGTSSMTVADATHVSHTTTESADPARSGDIVTEALDGAAPVRTSRSSAERAPLPSAVEAEAMIEGSLFAQKTVPIRADASEDSPVLATIAKGKTLQVTGETRGGWTQVVHNDLPRWVATELVDEEEPKLAPEEGTLSTAPCGIGSGVESGLQADTVRVYRAVCARFPQITSYGGLAGRGEHATGHSLDIMVGGQLGWDIAAFLQANRTELGVSYLIYEQRIWTVQRGGEGWRGMSDRGGATANHFDHVHVTTFGNAGSL
ncbi:SH3 domain-containing protein [Aeromicrobium duanguangcaii]|uniref:SH3 domain-containing protein n=1 Tax=Aeromicrobium duanguangcaii TaxID=2968086 RepID=A0ABY5KE77_9ACTN|nr:SH3 domain-containing protein [Aeromicrobium duanguangcaii]UUI67387.1 SH3 domain-containing protein [Aeromicrobium duanguangcaii]